MSNKELDLTNLKKSIKALEECINAYKINNDETIKGFIEDSCVKRYEFTIETSWKFMKKYLKLVYGREDKELTMNNIFRLMEGYGFIKSWMDWREYYDRRNDTSHEYNQDKAQKILGIAEQFLQDATFLYDKLIEAIEK